MSFENVGLWDGLILQHACSISCKSQVLNCEPSGSCGWLLSSAGVLDQGLHWKLRESSQTQNKMVNRVVTMERPPRNPSQCQNPNTTHWESPDIDFSSQLTLTYHKLKGSIKRKAQQVRNQNIIVIIIANIWGARAPVILYASDFISL